MVPITFKYSLRKYQQDINDAVESYIKDKKVHIVAAPGAGKTIIALKLLFDIQKPTLIFAPTIAIREQWVERMLNDFDGLNKEEVSTSLNNLKKYNVITYQSLYEHKPDEVESLLLEKGITVFVFDEAHHLRNAWFAHISKIINDIDKDGEVVTISLTATPPYDDKKLYKNYISLCGDIDISVGIPELVENNNLCPHQDFLFFNTISKEEEDELSRYRDISLSLAKNLIGEPLFIRAIATHRFIINYAENVTDVIANDKAFFTMVKILKINGIDLPSDIQKLNLVNTRITPQDLEALFSLVFIQKDIDFKIISYLCNNYKNAFKKAGAIYKGNMNLLYSEKITKCLTENKGKLLSINRIILNEQKSLKDKLKLVIISDFINDYKTVGNDAIDEIDDNQMGVIPIFNSIKNHIGTDAKVIVLTGSKVIIPSNIKKLFVKICGEYGIFDEKIEIKKFDVDFNYYEINIGSNEKTVKVITQLFKRSNVQVLVGTAALIGEVWDAPFVNTLIIASNVSSYITSNQIRGRVIRTSRDDPNKVANIWHLVTLDKINDKIFKSSDYEKIAVRLSHIEGLYFSTRKITSGISRFEKDIDSYINNANNINDLNTAMLNKATDRNNTKKSWLLALRTYKKDLRTIEISSNCDNNMKKNYRINLDNTIIRNIFLYAIASGATACCTVIPHPTISTGFIVATGALDFLAVSEFVNSIFYKRVTKDVDAMCKAITESLKENSYISDDDKFKIVIEKNQAYIESGNSILRNPKVIKKCVEEAFSDNHDTRYLIKTRRNIFNVPTLFDKSKESAERFYSHFKKHTKFRRAKLLFGKGNVGKLERLKIMSNDENRDVDFNSIDMNEYIAKVGVLSQFFRE